jgi:hypothetical protein
MQIDRNPITFEVELQAGDKLTLPEAVAVGIGPGHWRVTISPVETGAQPKRVRGHSAFLNSYAPEDEGLYDDCSAR